LFSGIFPLVQIHPNALPSSKAAEAAGKQGKFWEMHDILFDTQNDWKDLGDPKDKFTEYARQLELDEQMFSNDFDSDEVSEKITSRSDIG
jgi:protein-disulfide isomerase